MIQEIITHLIVFAAVLYTIYSSVKLFMPSKSSTKGHTCNGCSGCDLKTIQKKRALPNPDTIIVKL